MQCNDPLHKSIPLPVSRLHKSEFSLIPTHFLLSWEPVFPCAGFHRNCLRSELSQGASHACVCMTAQEDPRPPSKPHMDFGDSGMHSLKTSLRIWAHRLHRSKSG